LEPRASVKRLFLLQFLEGTVGRTFLTGDQLNARPISNTIAEQTQTSMAWVGFKPTIPAFERAKTIYSLDYAATLIGPWGLYETKIETINFIEIFDSLKLTKTCFVNPTFRRNVSPTYSGYKKSKSDEPGWVGSCRDYSYLLTLVHHSWISYTLKMEAICSSETSANKIPTRRHIPEDGILHSHRRENLKSYMTKT
jgi:hypothetical protein